jgi:hypothetical protein
MRTVGIGTVDLGGDGLTDPPLADHRKVGDPADRWKGRTGNSVDAEGL